VLGLAFAAMSVTPSLVPRGWVLQAALVGVCAVTGYGLGAFLGWVYRSLELPDLPNGVRRVVWRVLGLAALVGLPVAAWVGRGYQSEQRELLGMEPSVPWLWVLAPWLGLLVAALPANGVPAGHGHVYDETVVTAWSEIVGPPSLPAAEVEAIRSAIADLPH